jgi:hypothetical protein
MRRAPWFSPFAVVIGLWFALFIGEPSLVSPCAMHGAFASHGQAQGHAHGSAMAHSASTSAHHAAPSDAPAPEKHDCSCIGSCTAGAAAVVAVQPSIADFGVGTYAHVDEYPSAGLRPTQPPEFSRPYTTGPPRA